MKLTLFSFFFFACLFANGQIVDPVALITTRATQNRAFQKVKSELIYVYDVDKKGRPEKKGSLRNEILYNEQGRITKVSSFFPNSTTISENEYDERGNQVKIISRARNGAVRQTMVFEYDDNDVVAQIRYYDPAGKITSVHDVNEKSEHGYKRSYGIGGELLSTSFIKYDSATRTYISQIINPSGEIRYEDTYVLSGDNRILQWASRDNMIGKASLTQYKYDDNGNQTEELRMDASGKPVEKNITTYNDKNLPLEKVSYSPVDHVKEIFRHKYTFTD